MSTDSTANARGSEIVFTDVVKQYPGQTEPAVDHLSLGIDAGEFVTFVGPSGCGKTTSLKMINRLIEPTSGTITIDGQDTRELDADTLRRRIGYVIQGGGLFPHMTVAGNIAVVPNLLKWDKKRIRRRTDELLELVGLDPAVYRDRYPRELSGGQQQRVGVARGLAADPPVMLMDEPFGAVDPITRSRLQDELLDVQSKLHKTIVCVTHDIDEAIKLGDRICVMADHGRIAQYDTASEILANPADDFVADFTGSGSALKQLALEKVSSIRLEPAVLVHVGDPVPDVLELARRHDTDQVIVLDADEAIVDWYWTINLRGPVVRARPGRQPILLDEDSSLDTVLDALVTSLHEGAIIVDDHEHFLGIATFDEVTAHVRRVNAAPGAIGDFDAGRTHQAPAPDAPAHGQERP
ncbi:adenosinetriphosphatase [Propionibacterium ruminifibrarum]|uniref:ABC-type quaternary amine transporter n=1 Tax=Propionibacterium ruminifibrarum TaxID=1962131 RepID=A0A375I7A8_9ACTN|nr:betaine/proline/choline family ABC transporter ATP-binding protein [Propionibacterium ruminifibrarum]SPF69320.1 adenosinetriphosphatase [Propionibacterium ruminifibrarum]